MGDRSRAAARRDAGRGSRVSDPRRSVHAGAGVTRGRGGEGTARAVTTIHIRPGDRSLFLGATRSGKSKRATSIATRFNRVFVVANTEDDVLSNSTVARGEAAAARALRAGAHRLTYIPDRSEYDRLPAIVNALVEIILATGAAWCFLFHELGDIGDESKVPPAIAYLWRAGASRGHVVLACFQRSVNMPRLATSQSNHVFLFALYDRGDLDRAAAFMGPRVRTDPLPIPFDYGYYYRGPDGALLRVPGLR